MIWSLMYLAWVFDTVGGASAYRNQRLAWDH